MGRIGRAHGDVEGTPRPGLLQGLVEMDDHIGFRGRLHAVGHPDPAPTAGQFHRYFPVHGAAVDIDDQDELAEEYEVSSIPCLVVFNGGEETERKVGLQPKKRLQKMLGVK